MTDTIQPTANEVLYVERRFPPHANIERCPDECPSGKTAHQWFRMTSVRPHEVTDKSVGQVLVIRDTMLSEARADDNGHGRSDVEYRAVVVRTEVNTWVLG